jgi:hypothetical protein
MVAFHGEVALVLLVLVMGFLILIALLKKERVKAGFRLSWLSFSLEADNKLSERDPIQKESRTSEL